MRASHERNLFLFDLPPVFANDDAAATIGRLDAYILVAEEGKRRSGRCSDAVGMLGESASPA